MCNVQPNQLARNNYTRLRLLALPDLRQLHPPSIPPSCRNVPRDCYLSEIPCPEHRILYEASTGRISCVDRIVSRVNVWVPAKTAAKLSPNRVSRPEPPRCLVEISCPQIIETHIGVQPLAAVLENVRREKKELFPVCAIKAGFNCAFARRISCTSASRSSTDRSPFLAFTISCVTLACKFGKSSASVVW